MAANFTAQAFDNAAVTGAANPSPNGYHHGPIPNPNTGWLPPIHAINPRANITTAMNAAAPRQGTVMSGVNTGVCDIDLGGVMCGTVCADQPSLRRHIRNTHPGALVNPDRTNTNVLETVAGQNAIKLWVRSGGWRAAQYAREPGRGPSGGLVDQYATAMEAIAAADAGFAQQFGTRFHREINVPNPPSAHAEQPLSTLSSQSMNTRLPISSSTPQPPASAEHMPELEPEPEPNLMLEPPSKPAHARRIRKQPKRGVQRVHMLTIYKPEAPKTPASHKRKRGPTPPGTPKSPTRSGRASKTSRRNPTRAGRKSKTTGGRRNPDAGVV